jgi:hypothetical protein
MIRFDRLPDGNALVRYPKGVLKICDLYTRNGDLFIRHSTGFMQIGAKYDDKYLTANSGISILELDHPLLTHDNFGRPKIKQNGVTDE